MRAHASFTAKTSGARETTGLTSVLDAPNVHAGQKEPFAIETKLFILFDHFSIYEVDATFNL